jgi:NAD(P)-dependent dehydrogenase (short-subunit alcohol dehydrogenase family)
MKRATQVQEDTLMTSSQKVAVITGGARGIGRAIAEQLATDGCAVLIADTRGEAAEQAATELVADGTVAAASQTV